MGLVLGMRPLSQFDANAVPMWRLFHKSADLAPYSAIPEGTTGAAVNTSASVGAAQSAGWNFDTEDKAPMDELNQVLWQAVKGPDVPYPGRPAAQSLDN